jgi:hypothetical protein
VFSQSGDANVSQGCVVLFGTKDKLLNINTHYGFLHYINNAMATILHKDSPLSASFSPLTQDMNTKNLSYVHHKPEIP